jgi:hypothetical protein
MRSTTAVGWAIFAGCTAVALCAAFLAVLNLATPTPLALSLGPKALEVAFPILALTFPGVGALIVARDARNRVGWIFLATALAAEVAFLGQEYGLYAMVTAQNAIPGGDVVLWAVTWSWSVAGAFLSLLPALFPDGELPSRRWRLVYWLTGVGLLAEIVGNGARTRVDLGAVVLVNPLGLGLADDVASFLNLTATLLWSASLIVGFAALTVRYRRANRARQQIKWFLYATALCTASLVGSSLFLQTAFGDLLSGLSAASALGIPVATAIAIFRYRLYDIDVLINRTLVYGATTATIGAAFFLGLVALEAVLRPITNGSDLAVAAATLISFALFQPVRRYAQGAVDRRFDRSRYDAARTLDLFADRLRDEVDLTALRADLLNAVQLTMAPAHASLWLRERPR